MYLYLYLKSREYRVHSLHGWYPITYNRSVVVRLRSSFIELSIVSHRMWFFGTYGVAYWLSWLIRPSLFLSICKYTYPLVYLVRVYFICVNGRLRLAIFYLQIMVSDDTQHTIQKSIRSTGADAFFGICGCDVLMGDKKTLCKEMWHHHIKWALVTTNMIIITASLMIIVIIIVFGIVTSSWGQHRRWKAKFQ